MIIYVVVPVAIHQRSLDKAVAKEYVIFATRASLLASHMRIATAWIFCLACQLTQAIVSYASPIVCHRLALVYAPWQFALLILQQCIVIYRRLRRWTRRHHRHHPLCVGPHLLASHSPIQLPHILSPARMLHPQLLHHRTPSPP